MQSSNPVFNKPNAFAPARPDASYPQTIPPEQNQAWGQQPAGYPQAPYGQPQAPYGQPQRGLMTIDDVITKSAIVMGTLFAAAAVTFMLMPVGPLLYGSLVVSGLVGFVAVLVVSLRRRVNPAFVIAYAVIEGVFIGAFSKLFEALYPGIVVQAIFATFVAAGATLAVYKFFRIRVTNTFRKVVMISTISLAGVLLLNFVLSLFGINMGMRSMGTPLWLPVLVSVIAVVLAVFNLILDFDYIEQGVRNGADDSESWRAAFGLTVTMVWLYTEILRILSYFRN